LGSAGASPLTLDVTREVASARKALVIFSANTPGPGESIMIPPGPTYSLNTGTAHNGVSNLMEH